MRKRPVLPSDTALAKRKLRLLSRPIPPADFMNGLREEFILGEEPARGRGRARGGRSTAQNVVALVGCLIVAAVGGFFLNNGPSWQLAGVSGSGSLVIDGISVPASATQEIRQRLHAGADVTLSSDVQLDLRLPGTALIQITGGSSARLPGSPGRWYGKSMAAFLEAGEMRVTTGPAFPGTTFHILTPEAQALVTGTTLAVLRPADASCVCVFSGRVRMFQGRVSEVVEAGYRRSVFQDGRAPLLEPIRPMETMKLRMLFSQGRELLGH